MEIIKFIEDNILPVLLIGVLLYCLFKPVYDLSEGPEQELDEY